MIISDLSHLEVVAETTSIVGGNGKLPSFQLAKTTLQGISSQLSSPLKINSIVTTGNQATSATVGSFTVKVAGKPVKGVLSASLAKS
jgi:hypothetical protein